MVYIFNFNTIHRGPFSSFNPARKLFGLKGTYTGVALIQELDTEKRILHRPDKQQAHSLNSRRQTPSENGTSMSSMKK
jgi:hypothetical protein